MPNYGDPKYWEQRYAQVNSTFDWLEDYDTLKPIIEEMKFHKDIKTLVIGCGNAEFSENLYNDGYKNIYNIDICHKVIEFMKKRDKDKKEMIYEVMDARDIKYEDNTFDLVFDKSTTDSILCGEKSFLNTAIVFKEVQRVLKTGGIYIVISYGTPENRVFHLVFIKFNKEREHLSFDITIYNIKKEYKLDENLPGHEKLHYVYICKKKNDADVVCKEKMNKVFEELNKEEKIEVDLIDEEEDDEEEEENYNLEDDVIEDLDDI